MKKITILALIGVLFSFTACDDETSAPQKVKDAFAKKFPTATSVAWDKESDTEWEAEFKVNGKEHSANFIQDGTWVETEYEVIVTEIPQIVINAIESNFKDYDIEEMELSKTAKGIVYEFGIEKGEVQLEIAIDGNGTIVKKEQKEGQDEESEDDDN